MAEDYLVTRVKDLLKYYQKQLTSADKTERVIYSIIISDLKGLLVDLAHY